MYPKHFMSYSGVKLPNIFIHTPSFSELHPLCAVSGGVYVVVGEITSATWWRSRALSLRWSTRGTEQTATNSMEAFAQRSADLVLNVLYSLQKEAVRVVLVGCVTLLLRELYLIIHGCQVNLLSLLPSRLRLWVERASSVLRVVGALAFVLCATVIAVGHYVYDCPATVPLCALSPPPPPPPPPPAALITAAKGVTAWCRRHPLQLAGGIGALLVADFLNLFVRVDQLDPLVRIVQPAVAAVMRLWNRLLPVLLSIRGAG